MITLCVILAVPQTLALFGRPWSLRFLHVFSLPAKLGLFVAFSRIFNHIIAGYYMGAVFTTHHTRSKNTVFGGPGPLPHYDQMSESFDRLHIEKPECRN